MTSLKLIAVLFTLATVACSTGKEFLQPVKVQGIAMEPALHEGDRIFVLRNPAEFSRGDIILFYFPPDPRASYIKRVIGLPRETIKIREGKVQVNGTPLSEPYVDPKNNQFKGNDKEITIPDNTYFVMGDNRDNSSDSRTWGTVDRRLIYAKFVGKYYSSE